MTSITVPHGPDKMKSSLVLLLAILMVCVTANELEESLGKIANVKTG